MPSAGLVSVLVSVVVVLPSPDFIASPDLPSAAGDAEEDAAGDADGEDAGDVVVVVSGVVVLVSLQAVKPAVIVKLAITSKVFQFI